MLEKDRKTNKTSKAKIQSRLDAEPKVDSKRLIPPKWLDDTAKKEFKRLVKLYKEADIFNDLDLTNLGIYCQYYSQYLNALDHIKREGQVLIKELKPIKNPWLLYES